MDKAKMVDLLIYRVIQRLKEQNYTSCSVQDSILTPDPRLDDDRWGFVVAIRTSDGKRHSNAIDYKKMLVRNSATSYLVDNEFLNLASHKLSCLLQMFDLIDYDLLDNRIREIEEEIACLH